MGKSVSPAFLSWPFCLDMARHFPKTFINGTLAESQRHYPEPLTEEDARAMVDNVADFFDLLGEWDSIKQSKGGDRSQHDPKKIPR